MGSMSTINFVAILNYSKHSISIRRTNTQSIHITTNEPNADGGYMIIYLNVIRNVLKSIGRSCTTLVSDVFGIESYSIVSDVSCIDAIRAVKMFDISNSPCLLARHAPECVLNLDRQLRPKRCTISAYSSFGAD